MGGKEQKKEERNPDGNLMRKMSLATSPTMVMHGDQDVLELGGPGTKRGLCSTRVGERRRWTGGSRDDARIEEGGAPLYYPGIHGHVGAMGILMGRLRGSNGRLGDVEELLLLFASMTTF